LCPPESSNISLGLLESICELSFQNQNWSSQALKYNIESVNSKKELLKLIWSLVCLGSSEDLITEAVYKYNKLNDSLAFDFKEAVLAKHFELNPLPVHFRTSKSIKELNKLVSIYRTFGMSQAYVKRITKTLDKIGDTKIGLIKEKVFLPFYIQEKDLVVWPTTQHVTIYGTEMLKSTYQMHQKNIEAVAEKVIVTKELFEEDLIKQINN